MADMTPIPIQTIARGGALRQVVAAMPRERLPRALRAHARAVGPYPRAALEAFVDLGMTDGEIGRYFKVPRRGIAALCDHWQIRR